MFGKAFYLTVHERKEYFLRDCQVNAILNDASCEKILGFMPKGEKIDVFACTIWAVHKFRNEDLEKLRPHFVFKSIEVIRKTLEATTQLAKAIVNISMQRHYAAQFKGMNCFCLDETVSTDLIFANTKDFKGNMVGIGLLWCIQPYDHHLWNEG